MQDSAMPLAGMDMQLTWAQCAEIADCMLSKPHSKLFKTGHIKIIDEFRDFFGISLPTS